MTMDRKGFALLLVVVFATSLVMIPQATVRAQLKTIVVPDDYPSIQTAISNAPADSTIFVKKGVYNETIRVEKPVNLKGEDRQNTIINGQIRPPNAAIYINSDCDISGFTIQNSNEGIDLMGVNIKSQPTHCKISNNIITKNGDGILAQGNINVEIS